MVVVFDGGLGWLGGNCLVMMWMRMEEEMWIMRLGWWRVQAWLSRTLSTQKSCGLCG